MISIVKKIRKKYGLFKYRQRCIMQQKNAILRRIDTRHIPNAIKNEVVLFCVIYNEKIRLPFFLKHYRALGVQRFFFIDNNSTDGSSDFLITQNDCHVFSTNDSYGEANFGTVWIQKLQKEYLSTCWCLHVDADELFVYDGYETTPIHTLIQKLESEKATGVHSLLIDMYSQIPLEKMPSYEAGGNIIEFLPYFDRDTYIKIPNEYPHTVLYRTTGGPRKRLFDIEVTLDKFVLYKYSRSIFIAPGAHDYNRLRISHIQCAVLHFKFLDTFQKRVVDEVNREEHYDYAAEYKTYLSTLTKNAGLSFFYPGSQLYKNSSNLVEAELITPLTRD